MHLRPRTRSRPAASRGGGRESGAGPIPAEADARETPEETSPRRENATLSDVAWSVKPLGYEAERKETGPPRLSRNGGRHDVRERGTAARTSSTATSALRPTSTGTTIRGSTRDTSSATRASIISSLASKRHIDRDGA